MNKIFGFLEIVFDLVVGLFFLYLFYLSLVGQPACIQAKDLTFGVCRESHEKIKQIWPNRDKFETAHKITE